MCFSLFLESEFLFLNCVFIAVVLFWTRVRVTTKWSKSHVVHMYVPCSGICTAFLTLKILHHSGTCFKVDEFILKHYHSVPIVCVRAHFWCYTVGLQKVCKKMELKDNVYFAKEVEIFAFFFPQYVFSLDILKSLYALGLEKHAVTCVHCNSIG